MTVIFVALSESYIIYPITKLTESDMAEQNRDIRQFSENVMKMQDGIKSIQLKKDGQMARILIEFN